MKKSTSIIIALGIALVFGTVAFTNDNAFIALYSLFICLLSMGVALGLWWEKPEEEKLKECDCCGWDDNGYQHEPFCSSKNEPTFTEKIKAEEKRIRKTRSDKGAKRV